jgi:hypothetical protein
VTKTLKEIFTAEGIVPVPDREVKWLRIHRPSVAFILCVMSGPWKIGRRQTVQSNALKILGDMDLYDLNVRDIVAMSPLDWQVKYLTAARNTARSSRSAFDDLFDITDTNHRYNLYQAALIIVVRQIHARAHGSICAGMFLNTSFKKPLPKVLGMFVRDFLFQDIVPQDRHVRKWLKDHKLPTKPDLLMKMFQDEKLQARGYARALFNEKSSNPVHAPTKAQRKS